MVSRLAHDRSRRIYLFTYRSCLGGSSNAFTASDHTNYYFDVVPQQLSAALDRFAQFFLNPLFTESATDREVNAVDSEHVKNIPIDAWRISQLENSTSNPNHAYSKFGTGNIETLDTIPKEKGIQVREELLKFHNKWYSSNLMSLAVLGQGTSEVHLKLLTGKHHLNSEFCSLCTVFIGRIVG